MCDVGVSALGGCGTTSKGSAESIGAAMTGDS